MNEKINTLKLESESEEYESADDAKRAAAELMSLTLRMWTNTQAKVASNTARIALTAEEIDSFLTTSNTNKYIASYRLDFDQKKEVVQKYMTKNNLNLKDLISIQIEDQPPPLRERIGTIRQLGIYENPTEALGLKQVSSIEKKGSDADEARAKKTAQQNLVDELVGIVAKKLGIDPTKYPFPLSKMPSAFQIDRITQYDQTSGVATCNLQNPSKGLIEAFVRAYLEHHQFPDHLQKGIKNPIRFSPTQNFRGALSQLAAFNKVEIARVTVEGLLKSIAQAGSHRIPVSERTKFEAVFNKHKVDFNPKADIISTQNFPVWYRMMQEWPGDEKEKPGAAGHQVIERILYSMTNAAAKDILNRFKRGILNTDPGFQSALGTMLDDIKTGNFTFNPEVILAMAKGNLGEQTSTVQTAAQEVIEHYFPAHAKTAMKMLAG